jgi:hypothetical protein
MQKSIFGALLMRNNEFTGQIDHFKHLPTKYNLMLKVPPEWWGHKENHELL